LALFFVLWKQDFLIGLVGVLNVGYRTFQAFLDRLNLPSIYSLVRNRSFGKRRTGIFQKNALKGRKKPSGLFC
jgi:hypothetical protein